MNRKQIVVGIVGLFLICVSIIFAQKQVTKISKQKLYNPIFSAPTMAEKKQLYSNLTPAQKADIWKWDMLIKVKEYELTGTEKGKILTDLSAAFFPDLFDVEKTGSKPAEGDFAQRPEAKHFFEIIGRYSNAFSAEESKTICAVLGNPTDPLAEKALKDKIPVSAPDAPERLVCVCSAESFCNSCGNHCYKAVCEISREGCGCFWISQCTGICF